MKNHLITSIALLLVSLSASGQNLAQPDEKPADLSKPVQVFLLLGQSNMFGLGHISGTKGETLEQAVKTEKLYPFLIDETGNWTERQDVRNVQVTVGRGGGMQVVRNEWMTVKGTKMGPEFGMGHLLGNAMADPVLILKSCIGNRSLGWDLLPPGSQGFEFTGKERKTGREVTYTYAGYKESPLKWEKGTEPQKIAWYAGKQWDDDIAHAKAVLSELDKYYPGAKGYEVAGFFWWQGEKDAGDEGHSARYEENLVYLIKSLRKEFDAPNAKFVLATMGEATKGMAGNTGKILQAHLAVDGQSGKYPEFKGNVATIYSHPMARGGSGNGHYGGNAKVYMDVGLAMGEAMLELMKNGK